jgi:hypothetical protein
MAEHYGTFVGTPKQSSPINPVDNAYERIADQILVRDVYTNAGATAQNDTIQCAVLGWETIIDPDGSKVHFTAGGAGCTLSLGDATHATALDNAVDIHAAGSANLLSAITVPNYYLPLWQLLGYASLAAAKAVAKQCELLFTIGGANFAAGTITWKLVGIRRI